MCHFIIICENCSSQCTKMNIMGINKYSIHIQPFFETFHQVIATTVKNFHMFNVGLVVAMPAIIIASLSGIHNERNQNEFLHATASQSSWIGSLTYLIQPFASIISGPISGTFQKLNISVEKLFNSLFFHLDR